MKHTFEYGVRVCDLDLLEVTESGLYDVAVVTRALSGAGTAIQKPLGLTLERRYHASRIADQLISTLAELGYKTERVVTIAEEHVEPVTIAVDLDRESEDAMLADTKSEDADPSYLNALDALFEWDERYTVRTLRRELDYSQAGAVLAALESYIECAEDLEDMSSDDQVAARVAIEEQLR